MDLNAAITQFAKRVRPLAGDRAMVRTELDPKLGWIAAGPEQIDWLLVNLAADAYDGMPGGGEIIITTANVELNPGAASELDLPPGAYVQLEFTVAAGAMDVGSTIRQIVRQMHGAVSDRRTCGPGVVVDILLPRKPEQTQSTGERARESGQLVPVVLVVSDNPLARGLTCDLLRDAGYRVVEAAHGNEAESVLAAGEVDLMITDIVMPEKDGLETILSVRAIHPGLKIIAVAESSGGYQLRAAKLLGADSVMSRPLTRAVLSDAVREQIGGARGDEPGEL